MYYGPEYNCSILRIHVNVVCALILLRHIRKEKWVKEIEIIWKPGNWRQSFSIADYGSNECWCESIAIILPFSRITIIISFQFDSFAVTYICTRNRRQSIRVLFGCSIRSGDSNENKNKNKQRTRARLVCLFYYSFNKNDVRACVFECVWLAFSCHRLPAAFVFNVFSFF